VLVAGLVAVAAVAHATWNIAVKRAATTTYRFIFLGALLGAIVFAPFGIWSLVAGGTDLRVWVFWAAISGALQVVYFLILQRGYRVGDVSVVYPLARGTGPLLSVVLAILVLGERPTWLELLGAAVVIAGVMVIGFAGDRDRRRSNRPGIGFGLLVGLLIAIYTIWDAMGVTTQALPPVGLYWGSVVFQVLILAVPALHGVKRTIGTAKTHPVTIVLFGILSPLAYILVLYAIQLAPVSVIAPAREVSVIIVGLAGWLLFKEPNPAQRLIGAGILLAGVALLAL
jgi:drug/metabolite transporter (DMT)-like permease